MNHKVFTILFLIIAIILFIFAAVDFTAVKNPLAWGLVALAISFLPIN